MEIDNNLIFIFELVIIGILLYLIYNLVPNQKNKQIKKNKRFIVEKGGTIINSKMLTGIIPANWKETVTEYKTYYSCRVIGESLTEDDWDELFNEIKTEFGSSLMEVYSNTSNGLDFIVYLKKSLQNNK